MFSTSAHIGLIGNAIKPEDILEIGCHHRRQAFPSLLLPLLLHYVPGLLVVVVVIAADRCNSQLPYEAENPFSNIMSFFLAVGSPALATFSLSITIMNRAWIKELFKHRLLNFRYQNSGYVEQVEAVKFLLQEGQQVPLRASQERGQ